MKLTLSMLDDVVAVEENKAEQEETECLFCGVGGSAISCREPVKFSLRGEFGQRPEGGEKVGLEDIQRVNFPCRGKSKCKDPEAEAFLACL